MPLGAVQILTLDINGYVGELSEGTWVLVTLTWTCATSTLIGMLTMTFRRPSRLVLACLVIARLLLPVLTIPNANRTSWLGRFLLNPSCTSLILWVPVQLSRNYVGAVLLWDIYVAVPLLISVLVPLGVLPAGDDATVVEAVTPMFLTALLVLRSSLSLVSVGYVALLIDFANLMAMRLILLLRPVVHIRLRVFRPRALLTSACLALLVSFVMISNRNRWLAALNMSCMWLICRVDVRLT